MLTFNLRLLAAPVRCIEYVVIHEFTHFLHPDHSPAFYAEIAANCRTGNSCRKLCSIW
ncbi:MAG: M48 family metallopeptidase [Ruminococcus callidus]